MPQLPLPEGVSSMGEVLVDAYIQEYRARDNYDLVLDGLKTIGSDSELPDDLQDNEIFRHGHFLDRPHALIDSLITCQQQREQATKNRQELLALFYMRLVEVRLLKPTSNPAVIQAWRSGDRLAGSQVEAVGRLVYPRSENELCLRPLWNQHLVKRYRALSCPVVDQAGKSLIEVNFL